MIVSPSPTRHMPAGPLAGDATRAPARAAARPSGSGKRALLWLDALPLWALLAIIAAVALVARVATALQFAGPEYTDTAYYTTVARTLAHGGGLVDHSYWNYLYTGPGLAHPSNGYWLPLVSLTVAPFLRLFGDSFAAAEIAPILCSVAFVLVGFWVGLRLLGDRWGGLLVAAWTLSGGFFAAHATFADTFSLYGLLGSLTLAATIEAMRGSRAALLVAGASAGLGMLTRSDAALLPVAIVVGWAWASLTASDCGRMAGMRHRGVRGSISNALVVLGGGSPGSDRSRRVCHPTAVGGSTGGERAAAPSWRWLAAALGLCAAAVLPWLARNVAAFGTFSAPGSVHVLFLTRYDDLLKWHVDVVTPSRFLSQGFGALLSSRLEAGVRSLFVVALAANFLWLPFAAFGAWRARTQPWLVPPATYFVLLFLAMTVVLPYPAEHGTIVHALAPLEPWIGLCGVAGLRAVLRRVGRGHVLPRYEILGILYALLFSAAMVWMAATSWYNPASRPDYARVEAAFLRSHAAPGEPVLVIDPPVFEYESGRPGLVLPTEGPAAAIDVARHFGARYLVWDRRTIGAANPYADVASDTRFTPRATIGPVVVYEIDPALLSAYDGRASEKKGR